MVARKPSSQGEDSCAAYSEVSPLRQDAATLSQIRRKLRVHRKCHLQSGTNQPSAATAAVTEAARGCHYPCRLGKARRIVAGVDRAQDPKARLTSGKSPAVPESKVSVWFCVSGSLSGPGAITCRGSSAADGVVRCHFSSQLGHQPALARVTSLWGSASSSVKRGGGTRCSSSGSAAAVSGQGASSLGSGEGLRGVPSSLSAARMRPGVADTLPGRGSRFLCPLRGSAHSLSFPKKMPRGTA